MTWVAARRIYREPQYVNANGRRRGRPRTKAHVVGVFVVVPYNGQILPAWHARRRLVTVCGDVSLVCSVLIELDHMKGMPDWYAVALKKRLRREGFRNVFFCERAVAQRMIEKRKRPIQAERSFQNPDMASD